MTAPADGRGADIAIIIDVESTGLAEPIEPVELAWLILEQPATLTVRREFNQRYRPSKPIECGAMATHHIMDEDLDQCPPAAEARLPFDANYVIAHNVDYDWQVMGAPDMRRIDTCALARACWPECDTFSLGALLYYLDRSRARELTAAAHGALADCYLCLELLRHIVARFKELPTWEKLWRASEKARIPKYMPFGKHRPKPGETGTMIADLPRDYLEWCLRQADMDQYVLKAVRQALGRPIPEEAV